MRIGIIGMGNVGSGAGSTLDVGGSRCHLRRSQSARCEEASRGG